MDFNKIQNQDEDIKKLQKEKSDMIWKTVERMFKDIGINQVLVEAENDPDEAEGYIQINGVTGIIVDFEY